MGGRNALGDHDLPQFTVYPDGVGGVLVADRGWALLRADEESGGTGRRRLVRWLLHGAALALLPWLHTRFALVAGSLGALLLLRISTTKNPAPKGGGVSGRARGECAVLGSGTSSASTGVADPSAPYATTGEFSAGIHPRRARLASSSISASGCSRMRQC